MEPITRNLVFFSHALHAKDLPAEVVERVKYLLLDYLGVATAGSLSESSQPIYRMLAHSPSPGPCTVIGTTRQSSAESAALANGAAAHSLELDDTHQAGSIHLGVVIFSAAIALSEIQSDISADQFVAAVVAGYEVAARLAFIQLPPAAYSAPP